MSRTCPRTILSEIVSSGLVPKAREIFAPNTKPRILNMNIFKTYSILCYGVVLDKIVVKKCYDYRWLRFANRLNLVLVVIFVSGMATAD